MYEIVGPDGTTVSFNKDTDPNFMGYLDDITGLDSPEIRENAQNVVAGDGGRHDNFYAGRRPFTIAGTIFPTVGSNVKQELLQAAVSRARRKDAQLKWTPTGTTEERMVLFRAQQPCRCLGKVPKTFQVMGVSADFRVCSTAVQTSGAVVGAAPICTVNNVGDEEASVAFVIKGPLDGAALTIVNDVSGKQIAFIPNVLGNPAGSGVPAPGAGEIGTLCVNLTPNLLPAYLGYSVALGGDPTSTDQYGAIDPLNTDWTISAEPGIQTFSLHGSGFDPATTSLEVQWRDSWI